MNEYDLIKELLSRHHSGQADLSDEDAELLAMKAQRFGERFTPESKPFSKGAFDMADMATFGLLPDEWRPYSPGQDIHGETQADKFAGVIGSIGGMIGGAAAATKGAKMGWNAIKKAFAKRKADDIASNIYKGNLLGPGPNIPQLGPGRPLPPGPGVPQLPGRPGVPQLPSASWSKVPPGQRGTSPPLTKYDPYVDDIFDPGLYGGMDEAASYKSFLRGRPFTPTQLSLPFDPRRPIQAGLSRTGYGGTGYSGTGYGGTGYGGTGYTTSGYQRGGYVKGR